LRASDNFDDGVFDRGLWARGASTGVAIEERNGRLEATLSAQAVEEPDNNNFPMIFGTYGTHCRFAGDFDARVELELLEWPAGNGVAVQLGAWFPTQNLRVVRWSNRQMEQYGSWGTQTSPSSPSDDRRGALRIQRVGNRITTYFQRGRVWEALHTISGSFGSPLIGLQVLSKDDWFADTTVRIAFDNFSVAAEDRGC
jgi:hypothetical protein